MALTIRRLISWLGTLAVLGALAVGISRLPAQGGLVGELRWVFTRPIPPASMFRRAFELLRYAERCGQREDDIVRALLRDADPRVVQSALVVATDGLPRPGREFHRSDWSYIAQFDEWFTNATPDQRLAHLPYTLLTLWQWHSTYDSVSSEGDAPNRTEIAYPQRHCAAEDVCWNIAGTLEKAPDWRALAEAGVFYRSAPTQHIRLRLQVLDALLTPAAGFAPTPLDDKTVRAELVPTLEQVLALLADSRERVRWAAGRILTVAGDRRGLPAFREWLKAHPNIPPGATQMLAELFGPDWRTAP